MENRLPEAGVEEEMGVGRRLSKATAAAATDADDDADPAHGLPIPASVNLLTTCPTCPTCAANSKGNCQSIDENCGFQCSDASISELLCGAKSNAQRCSLLLYPHPESKLGLHAVSSELQPPSSSRIIRYGYFQLPFWISSPGALPCCFGIQWGLVHVMDPKIWWKIMLWSNELQDDYR